MERRALSQAGLSGGFLCGFVSVRAAIWGEAPSSAEGVLGLQTHFRKRFAGKGSGSQGFCPASVVVLSPQPRAPALGRPRLQECPHQEPPPTGATSQPGLRRPTPQARGSLAFPSPHGCRARAGVQRLLTRQINSAEKRRFCKHAKY